jgi:hypothetical protein
MQESTVGVHSDEQTFVAYSKFPELPVPRESHLLSEMSQRLLRIARLPRVSKPAVQTEDQEKEVTEEEEVKEERTGFALKRWIQMGKGYDAPDREYLAKRRKGLPPLHDGFVPVIYDPQGQPKQMRSLKIRRYDADGNPHVYEVMAPVGQKVDGEILDEEESAEIPVEPAAAPGTVIEGVGVVNEEGVVIAQPIRRRPPIPQKRKKKGGPGRSKKKIVPELGPDGVPIHPPLDANGELMTNAQGIQTEGTENGDTPMADAEDDDEEGSGEEGEIMDEDEDDHDVEMSEETTPVRSSSATNDLKPDVTKTPDISTVPSIGMSSLRSELKLEPDEPKPDSTETPLEPPPEPILEPIVPVPLLPDEAVILPEASIEPIEPGSASIVPPIETDPTSIAPVSLVPDAELSAIPDLPPPVVQPITPAEQTLPSPKPSSPPPTLSTEMQLPSVTSPQSPVPVQAPQPPQTPPPADPNGPFSPPNPQPPLDAPALTEPGESVNIETEPEETVIASEPQVLKPEPLSPAVPADQPETDEDFDETKAAIEAASIEYPKMFKS